MIHYEAGPETRHRYENWKRDWSPPEQPVRAIGGRVVVEFAPAVSSSSLIVPENASYTALVIHDSRGELKQGDEVMMLALEGHNFNHAGRILTIVEHADILGIATE